MICAKDNVAIKRISVNGSDIYKCNNKNYYCAYPVTYEVTKSGTYNIEVEDLAGNIRISKKKIKTDTTPPKIQSLQIKKDGKIYDKDKCAVKVGDKLILNLKAHEEVSKYSGIKINGTDLKTGTINVGNKTNFSIEIPITDKFGTGTLYGDYVIEIYGLSDKWGNATSYTIKNKVYFDSSYPEISEINITGGKLSSDKQKMTIYQNQKIVIDLTTEEKLGNNPEIYVCGHKTTFARLKNKNKKDKSEIYHYYAYLDSNYILQTANAFGYVDKCIPIEIKNYKNLSGNLGDDIIIDESNKSSNGIYLYYGNSELNKLYLASDKNEKDRAIAGDINQDGYVNEYDYLLLQRYLSKLQEFIDAQKKYANVDGNDTITNRKFRNI